VVKSGSYVPFSDLGYIPRDIVADAGFESYKTPAQIAREQAVAERRRNPSASTAPTTQSPVAAKPSNSGQAQTPQQPLSGFPAEGVQVASNKQIQLDPGAPGELDPNHKDRRTPEEVKRLFPEVKFQADVAARAQSLLKANKDRLNTEQTRYAQHKNPKSVR
jgi:hypothetical protein